MFTQMQRKRVVFGIDPGYGRCGFAAIVEAGSDWKCLDHGIISTAAEQDLGERLNEIYEDLSVLLTKHQPDLLVVEDLFFKQSTTTALKVAEARGVIRLLAQKKGIEVIEVKPTQVKLALTGDGKADKGQVQEMVKRVFNLKVVPQPDDAADALAVAWTGAMQMRFD